MNSKFYVSLEAARLLKEKGYNEECTTLYDCVFNEIIPAISVGLYRNECIKNDYYCSCPTKAEAVDWLEGKGWQFSIICADDKLYEFIVYFENEHISGYRETMLGAQDAAIITVLEKL